MQDCNYESVIAKCTEQLKYLFQQCNKNDIDKVYKPDETIKALKQENEYFRIQIETLRKTTVEPRVSPKNMRKVDETEELRLAKFELS